MTGRQRMIKTLRFEEPDRPPHFESMFQLENEAFGLAFPDFTGWSARGQADRDRAIGQCMAIYERIVDRYSWDALAVYFPWGDPDGIRAARRTFGDSILIGGIISGTVWSIDSIADWDRFSEDLADQPGVLHAEAERRTAWACAQYEAFAEAGAEFVYIANDVAFNQGPFVSPACFRELVTPYWARQVAHARACGLIPFIHTDGDIMPILDELLSLNAACLQSIDPMAGVDIAEVKRRCQGRLALMGNVQCSLMQDGPDEAIRRSAEYCLAHAAPGGGYVFSTSNTVFPGMPLKNYEFMLKVFGEFNARRLKGRDR
jgi:uroporphyrinogen decarboxylase